MSLTCHRCYSAGKTTLLDVIAGYKTGGKITGDILIDGHPKLDATWKVISAYAEQQDILNPYMSVRYVFNEG
jgi:ABC-type multidrug transport system ATPase subunit